MNDLTGRVIGAVIEVHRRIGPGMLESVYEECMAIELEERQISYRRQVNIPVIYRGRNAPIALRVDLLIEDVLIVELKAVENLNSVHAAQLLSYLRLSDLRLGLLINFKVARLVEGVRRIANNDRPPAPASRTA